MGARRTIIRVKLDLCNQAHTTLSDLIAPSQLVNSLFHQSQEGNNSHSRHGKHRTERDNLD